MSTVRRSVALPSALIEEALAAAPPEFANNLNGLFREALKKYIAGRRAEAFDREMAEMAADPGLFQASAGLTEDFRFAEADGL